MTDSKTAFIDDDLFNNVFMEEKHNHNFKTYPVNLVAMRFDWFYTQP
jgi:hypothetical protein